MGATLAYFRKFCEAVGITQGRQVTRAVVLSYQSYLFHYRKPDGTTGAALAMAAAGPASAAPNWLRLLFSV